MTSQITDDLPKETSFDRLVRLRTSWRKFHENQDCENAEATFLTAGITHTIEAELLAFPESFRLKLRDFGRDWEMHLASAALREGYTIYEVHLLLAIHSVQAFYSWITALLESGAPNRGAPLFFESNGANALHEKNWDCSFYFALAPAHTPDSLGISAGPGVQNPPKYSRIA